jgi:hypothetical protein
MATQNLFGLEGLADLGARTGADMRSTLLRVLTDLYVHRLSHTPDEERHYTELALRLLEVVDVPTRVAVARRFASYLSTPLRVLHWLSADRPEVAAELRPHPLLRKPIPEGGDTDNVQSPVETSDAIDLATAVELNELFFAANADERRLILLNLNVVAPVPAGGVRVAPDPSIGQRLEAAALARDREDFAHQLATSLRIPDRQANRITGDDLGEPVVVAGKALRMRREALYRILLFVNPAVGHSVERVHALAALYDALTPSAAEGMVAIWQALQPNESARARHRPLTWDDSARRRARTGPATAAQRTPVAPRTGDRRSAS